MLTKPKRYQLNKFAAASVASGHPWIFRQHASSALAVFADGQWLMLVDGRNQTVGFGIYEQTGAIAIRVLRRGPHAPDTAWLRRTIAEAMAKRASLVAHTNAIRWLNGESDGVAACVIEQFADTLVAQSYSAGSDALTRLAQWQLGKMLGVTTFVWRPGKRRQGGAGTHFATNANANASASGPPPSAPSMAPSPTFIREDDLTFAVDLASGQKTGAYLDLRHLRRAIRQLPIAGGSVLNLFSYTGMLGLAAQRAGAHRVINVDASASALAFAAAHHVAPVQLASEATPCQTFVQADIFAWLATQAAQHQLVIVDPPAMTSNAAQLPQVIGAYRKLYTKARALVAPNGHLVAACCTSRVPRQTFSDTVRQTLGPDFRLVADLPPEPDHPVGFAQADYLKVLIFARRA